LGQPTGELALVKGSRYRWPSRAGAIPWARQLGSILLEPMARAALACRNLTDISNGYLGMDALSASYLLPPLRAKLTPLQIDHQGGLMEQSNASIQRGRQG